MNSQPEAVATWIWVTRIRTVKSCVCWWSGMLIEGFVEFYFRHIYEIFAALVVDDVFEVPCCQATPVERGFASTKRGLQEM